MKRFLRATPTFLILGTLFLARASADVNAADALRSLDYRDRVLQQRRSAISQVAEAHAKYLYLRDNLFYGEGGLKPLSESLMRDTTRWINDWFRFLAIAADAEVLASEETQEKIKSDLARQQKEWYRIRDTRTRYTEKSREARRVVRALEPLSPELASSLSTPQYAAHIHAMNEHLARLEEAVESVTTAFEKAYFAELEKALSITTKALEARMQALLLDYPELEQAMARTREVLRAEEIMEPLRQDLEYRAEKIFVLWSNAAFFHFNDANAEFGRTLARARETLLTSGLSADALREGLQEIEAYSKESQRQSESILMGRSLQDSVFTYVQQTIQKERFVERCQTPSAPNAPNCEYLRAIAKLVFAPSEARPSMEREDLRVLEFAPDLIRAGTRLALDTEDAP